MWAQVDQILRKAAVQIADHVANFLPGVLVSVLLLVAAFVIAVLARLIVVRSLRRFEFDPRAEQWAAVIGWPISASPAQAVARLVYWTILLLGLLVSLTALDAVIPSQLALTVFEYLPHLLAALLILVIGIVAARFVARSVLIEAVNMRLRSARLISLGVKWLVLLVAVAMALDHLAIARGVLLLAFAILFGGVVLAAALAVGLGARDAVSRALEAQLREPPEGDDSISHV